VFIVFNGLNRVEADKINSSLHAGYQKTTPSCDSLRCAVQVAGLGIGDMQRVIAWSLIVVMSNSALYLRLACYSVVEVTR
jgi:hypothetical protein